MCEEKTKVVYVGKSRTMRAWENQENSRDVELILGTVCFLRQWNHWGNLSITNEESVLTEEGEWICDVNTPFFKEFFQEGECATLYFKMKDETREEDYTYTAQIKGDICHVLWKGEFKGVEYPTISAIRFINEGTWVLVDKPDSEDNTLTEAGLNPKQIMRLEWYLEQISGWLQQVSKEELSVKGCGSIQEIENLLACMAQEFTIGKAKKEEAKKA